jgi:3-oxoadipate enol-lactonase
MPWIDTGAVSLYYVFSGDKDGEPVVLIHELGGSSESWRDLAEQLNDNAVFAVDLRGAGRSEKPAGPYTIEELAEDIASFMRRILPDARWHLIGSAMGAFVALALAAQHRGVLRSLTLCEIVPSIDDRTRDYLERRVEKISHEGMAGVVSMSVGNSFPAGTPRPDETFKVNYAHAFRCQDSAAYSALSLALAKFDPRGVALGRIDVPTLVMAGALDFIWAPDQAKKMADLIPGARFVILEQAGHFPHIQNPELFAE